MAAKRAKAAKDDASVEQTDSAPATNKPLAQLGSTTYKDTNGENVRAETCSGCGGSGCDACKGLGFKLSYV